MPLHGYLRSHPQARLPLRTLARLRGGVLAHSVCAVLLAAMLGATGCARQSNSALPAGQQPLPETFSAELVTESLASFGPTSIRLHPLSRWDASAAQPTLVCGIEVLDQADDAIKWPLAAELTISPAQGSGADVRFAFLALDAAASKAMFDPVSRAYMVRLGDLPAWAASRPAVSVRIKVAAPLPPNSMATLENDGLISPAMVAPTVPPAVPPATTPAIVAPAGLIEP